MTIVTMTMMIEWKYSMLTQTVMKMTMMQAQGNAAARKQTLLLHLKVNSNRLKVVRKVRRKAKSKRVKMKRRRKSMP
jgi:hypothetical protein